MAKQNYRFQIQDRQNGTFVVFDLQQNRVLSAKFSERQQAIKWCFNNVADCNELQYRPGKKVYHRKDYGPVKPVPTTKELKDLGKRLEKIRDLKKEVMKEVVEPLAAAAGWEPAYISTHSGNYTVVVGKKTFTFGRSHKCYSELVKAITNKDLKAFEANIDTVQGIKTFFKENAGPGKIEIKDGEITFAGEVVHHVLVGRIFEAMDKGEPHENLVKFLENLLQNPNAESIEAVYKFLEDKSLPITADGHFLAYKKVDVDGMDFYTHTMKTELGKVLKMDRASCDPNRLRECGNGIHAGSLNYAENRYQSGQGLIFIVKINPKDVCCVPVDSQDEKIRVCEYLPVELYKDYSPKPVEPVQLEPDLDDEDFEDENDDDSSLEDWDETDDNEDW